MELLAGLALEVALRPAGGVLPLDQAAAAAGIDTYAEIVDQYTVLAGELIPRLIDAMGAVLRTHLVAVAS